MLRHESGHIPLVCSQCNMTFQSKENYSLHVQSHENELHVNVPFTTNDREMIIKSWNENSLPKYPRLHSVNYV